MVGEWSGNSLYLHLQSFSAATSRNLPVLQEIVGQRSLSVRIISVG